MHGIERLDDYEHDEVMCNLMPMVREYMNISAQEETSSRKGKRIQVPGQPRLPKFDLPTADDYVYDIYVRDDSVSPAEDARLGSLLWEDPDDKLYMHDEDSSQEGGDDDYDSNAESNEFNDYPDEESLSEYSGFDGEEDRYSFSDEDFDQY
jgi:hypothetical protein